jgi:hypothetical protein
MTNNQIPRNKQFASWRINVQLTINQIVLILILLLIGNFLEYLEFGYWNFTTV